MKITKLVIRHAPALCVGAGVVGVIFGTVMACKATTKLEDVVEECKQDKEETNTEDKKEAVKLYGRNVWRFTKLYGLPVFIIGLSLFDIVGGYKILNKRYVAVVGAYGALRKEHGEYRAGVIERHGKDEDLYLRHGLEKEENGSYVFIPDRDLSDYAVFFGNEYSELARDDPQYNYDLLLELESQANDIFERQGHLYLNDVYKMLSIDRIDDFGIGWVYGIGDDYISFGIKEPVNAHAVNGTEQVFVLDFNHDGCILPYL